MDKKKELTQKYEKKRKLKANNIFLLKQLNKKIDDINEQMMKNHLLDLSELLGNRKQLLLRNLGSGIAKGIGIGIGVTVITAILVILLQKIVTLNIPVIGEYIADIVDIVERSR